MSYGNVKQIYKDFNYPEEFLKMIELNLTNFDVWYFIVEEDILIRIKGLKKRYPDRKLIPFARRGDCDDIACFEIGKEGTVQIVHDFSSSGYEQRREYKCFWDWLKEAVEEMIERYEEDKECCE